MIYSITEGQQAEEYLKKKKESQDREKKSDSASRARYVEDRWTGTAKDKHPTSVKNPKYNTAREIESHRNRYGSVMPKGKTESEKKYDRAKGYEHAVASTAEDVVNKDFHRRIANGEKLNNEDYNVAADAYRRKIRHDMRQFRGHINEFGIFSGVAFI